jgi:hypothetical protein
MIGLYLYRSVGTWELWKRMHKIPHRRRVFSCRKIGSTDRVLLNVCFLFFFLNQELGREILRSIRDALSMNKGNMFQVLKRFAPIVPWTSHFYKWSPKWIFLTVKMQKVHFLSLHSIWSTYTYWSSTEIYAQRSRINRLICCKYISHCQWFF